MTGMRALFGLAAMLLLAGCLQGPGDDGPPSPGADAAPAAEMEGEAPANEGEEPEGVAEETAEDAAPADPGPASMEDFLPAPPAIPAALRDRQAGCERGGGQLVQRGRTGIYDCLQQTRDAGRRCTREGECQGACLARSQSCAPFSPLLGCHEVLDGGGARVTLCLE